MEGIQGFFEMLDEMSATLDELNGFLGFITNFIIMLGIAIALLQCFFGFRLFRIQIAIGGFLIGALLGGVMGSAMSDFGVGPMVYICGLAVGALGAWLGYKLFKVGAFIFIWAVAFAISALLLALMGFEDGFLWVGAIILATLVGILGLKILAPLVIVITAISGGVSVGVGLCNLLGNNGVGMGLGVILGVCGGIFQWMAEKKRRGVSPASADMSLNDFPSVKETIAQVKGSVPMSAVSGSFSAGPAVQKKNVLAQTDCPLWVAGMPIVITALDLVDRPEEPGKAALELGFTNVGKDEVKGVLCAVRCWDLLGNELTAPEKVALQDMSVAPGKTWSCDTPIPLPDGDTRRIELTVKNIVRGDGTAWTNEGGEAAKPLDLRPLSIQSEYRQEMVYELNGKMSGSPVETFKNFPFEAPTFWVCACGQVNTGTACAACGVSRDTVFETVDAEHLKNAREKRQAAKRESERLEQERESERRQAVQDKKDELKAKAKSAWDGIRGFAVKYKRPLIAVAVPLAVFILLGLIFGWTAAFIILAVAVVALGVYVYLVSSGAKIKPGTDSTPVKKAADSDGDIRPSYCPNCGAAVKANGKFCPNCGQAIRKEEKK